MKIVKLIEPVVKRPVIQVKEEETVKTGWFKKKTYPPGLYELDARTLVKINIFKEYIASDKVNPDLKYVIQFGLAIYEDGSVQTLTWEEWYEQKRIYAE